jgi:DNA-binding transcriptional LysR family regulator
MDRLYAMKVFQTVLEQGSFAAAGRTLTTSPAKVTRMVAALEVHLGVRLMHRNTRKLSLTEAGEAYLQRVRHILREVEEAESVASEQSHQLQGVLHVLATPVLASIFLSPLVAKWHAHYPEVLLDLTIDTFPIKRVEEFDVALLLLDESFNGHLVARPLATTEWIACASPAYLKLAGTPETPEQLRQHAHLKFQWPQNSEQFRKKVHFQPLNGAEVIEVELTPTMQTTSFEVLLSATLAGAGIAFFSRLQLDMHLERDSLVHVLPDWTLGSSTIYIALPTRKFMPTRTRVFIDFLAAFSPPARKEG